ncbi:hypothetical protein F4777DRAFT_10820 [Nemania sp. FL0916]|nr:hypothetical protein F4777DRAFT_10820 [Nemania sp. FL0916]
MVTTGIPYAYVPQQVLSYKNEGPTWIKKPPVSSSAVGYALVQTTVMVVLTFPTIWSEIGARINILRTPRSRSNSSRASMGHCSMYVHTVLYCTTVPLLGLLQETLSLLGQVVTNLS